MNPQKAAIRILVIDDHTVVREGLVAILEQEEDLTVVGEASNGREAVDTFQAIRPDLALMDLRMPVMDGVEAITEIRESSPNARIIILTTYDGDEDIYRGLQAGAQGYLLKDADRRDLVYAIRTVHAGRTHIAPEVAMKMALRVSRRDLTTREHEVLELLAAGKSNSEIAAALFIGEATVKTHVNNILVKLEVSDRTQAVTTALRRGLIHLQ
jgi:DNA-binding NarL/FixJ family response regulator